MNLFITRAVERADIVRMPQSVETLLTQAEFMKQRTENFTLHNFGEDFLHQEFIHLSGDGQFLGTVIVFWKDSNLPVKEAVVMGIDPINKAYYVFDGNNQQVIHSSYPDLENQMTTIFQEAISCPCQYLTNDYFEQQGAQEHLPTIRGNGFSLVLEADLRSEQSY